MLVRSTDGLVEMLMIETVGSRVRTTAQRMSPSKGLEKDTPIDRDEVDDAAARDAAETLAERMLDEGWVDPASAMMSFLQPAPFPGSTALSAAGIAGISNDSVAQQLGPVVHDQADFHADTCVEHGLDAHQAHVHTGLFIAWSIERELFVESMAPSGVAEVKAHTRTGPSFYERDLGGAFLGTMLTREGNAFARAYFDLEDGRYMTDYNEVFALDPAEPKSAYGVADTWESYEKLKPRIDERYAEFTISRTRLETLN